MIVTKLQKVIDYLQEIQKSVEGFAPGKNGDVKEATMILSKKLRERITAPEEIYKEKFMYNNPAVTELQAEEIISNLKELGLVQ